jgi:hypothetical protein
MTAGVVSLAGAARDKRLLGATITWRPSQIELLESLDGPAQLHLWAIARQTGKSSMAGAAAVANAALREDLDDMLPHGKWRSVPVIAPSESQAKDFIQVCQALVEGSPAFAEYAEVLSDRVLFRIPRVDEHGHRWTAKCAIRALPASAPSIRGLTAALVILEEMAHHGDTGGPADERRIWDAVAPMQTVFGSKSKVLGISTPFGENGLFYELFTAIEGGLMPHGRAVRRSIMEMIPDVDPAWLEARRAEMGDTAYEQEFLAMFVGSGGSFFDLRGIEFEEGPARPEDAVRWTCGLDPAFSQDRFGCALVGEALNEPGVFLTGAMEAVDPGERLRSLEARRAREDHTLEQIWQVVAPYAAVRPVRVVSDVHQADVVRSFFGRRGLEVEIVTGSSPAQTEAFVALRTRLVDGSLRCWKQPLLLEELRRVRTARSAERVVLPRHGGGHCDLACALALAVAGSPEDYEAPAAARTTKPNLGGGRSGRFRFSDSEFG